MSTIQEIEAAISKLSHEQLCAFREWFLEYDARSFTTSHSSHDASLDSELEHDTPELGAKLMKAAAGPFTPYSRADLESVAEQVLREKKRE